MKTLAAAIGGAKGKSGKACAGQVTRCLGNQLQEAFLVKFRTERSTHLIERFYMLAPPGFLAKEGRVLLRQGRCGTLLACRQINQSQHKGGPTDKKEELDRATTLGQTLPIAWGREEIPDQQHFPQRSQQYQSPAPALANEGN